MSTTHKNSNRDRPDSERLLQIKALTAQLAEREYPRVWVGEECETPEEALFRLEEEEEGEREVWEGVTEQIRKETLEDTPQQLRQYLPDEMLAQPPEKWEDLPEQLRAQLWGDLEWVSGPGDPYKIGYNYLDGLWVICNIPEALDGQVQAELSDEVRYIYAAKHHQVVIKEPSWERYLAGVAPRFRLVPIDDLTPEDLEKVDLETMDLYVSDWEPMGPFIMEDSERAWRAVDARLDS